MKEERNKNSSLDKSDKLIDSSQLQHQTTQSDTPLHQTTQTDTPLHQTTQSDMPLHQITQSDMPLRQTTQTDTQLHQTTQSAMLHDFAGNDWPAQQSQGELFA